MVDEQEKVKQRAENIKKDVALIVRNLIEKEKIVPDILVQMNEMKKLQGIAKEHSRIYLENVDKVAGNENAVSFSCREIHFQKSSLPLFIEEIQAETKRNQYVIILGGTEDTSKKVKELLEEKEIPCLYQKKLKELEKRKAIIVPRRNKCRF